MRVIGLICGTSLDAIDAALVDIQPSVEGLKLSLLAFAMQPYDSVLGEQVRRLLPPNTGSTADVCAVNVGLGEAFAAAALALVTEAAVPIESVDLVASHGQTVYHQIGTGQPRSTLQLGAPAVIAERTGCTVVADFRSRDIAAGGHGAPLVPYLDQLLFGDKNVARAAQNIGGMGNVTYLPPDGQVLAFDTGPGNVLIDEAVRLLTHGAATFDRDGRMAASGTVDETLLNVWLRHPFFRLPPPKSTGREVWGSREARRYVAQARTALLSDADTIATLTALTARSIAHAYRTFLGRVDEAIVGGGGARNPVLLAMLRAALPGTKVTTTDAFGLSADAKEAVAFAVLGYATIHGWPSNVPSATGAARPVVLGSITPGRAYGTLLRKIVAVQQELPHRIELVAGK